MSIEAIAVNGAIQVASRTVQSIRNRRTTAGPMGSATASLTDIASKAIVEPMVLVDSSTSQLEYIGDIMQSMLSLFTGYYMQAVSLSTRLGSISAAERLEPFNPKRNQVFEAYGTNSAAVLPRRLTGVNTLALEAAVAAADPKKEEKKEEKKPDGVNFDSKTIEGLREAANLSIGRMFNVTIVENNESYVLPIAVRLISNVMADSQMVDFFTFRTSFDLDLKERWHGYKSGRLAFWRDLVLCNDLIAKYRRAAIRDKSGVTAEVLTREAGHIAASLLSPDKVSLATATNLVVMSKSTLDMVEAQLSGSFSNMHVRRGIFDNTNLMVLAVVDPHFDVVTFYHRGVDQPSRLTVRDLKAAAKGGSTSVEDVMRTYLLGNPPSLR